MAGESIHYILFVFLVCTICVVVRGHRVRFLCWLGLLAVKLLNKRIILIYCIADLKCTGNKMRSVPGLLFLGQHKSLGSNSINFGNVNKL